MRWPFEAYPVDRLAPAHQDRRHHLRREQAVLDDAGRRREPGGQGRRLAHRPLVVGDDTAIRAERHVAQRDGGDPAYCGAEPEGEQLKGDRAVQDLDRLGRVGDDDETVRRTGDNLLAGVCAAAALYQPAVWGDLICAVNGHVEMLDVLQCLHLQAELARGVVGARRRGGAADVERPARQGRQQEPHRRAGAEPDSHAGFDQIRCRLRGQLPLTLDAHDSTPQVGCRDRALGAGCPPPHRGPRPAVTSVPQVAALSAITNDASASTRPAGIVVSPAKSLARGSFLSAPVTSHRIWRARASAG